MSFLTASKRMLNQNGNTPKKGWSINNKYEAIVIGDAYCGKSTYLNMLAESEKEANSPIMISQDRNEFEFLVKHKSKKVIFKVNDTANQERYRSLTQSYYKKAECVLLFFNLNSYESFENLDNWYTDALSYSKKSDKNFRIVLVGLNNSNSQLMNSSMLLSQLEVNQEQIDKFQQEHAFVIDYCEVDLANGKSLKEPFEILLENFLYSNENRILPTSYFEDSSKNRLNESDTKLSNNNLVVDQRKKTRSFCGII